MLKLKFNVLFLTLSILTFSGCESTTGGNELLSGLSPSALALRADTSNPARAAELRLQAATGYLDLGEFDNALGQLLLIDINTLPGLLKDDYFRASTRANLGIGDSVAADDALKQLSAYLATDYLLVAQVCEAQLNYQCAADGFIQASLDAGFDAAELPADIHDQIWSALSRARTGPQLFTHRYHHAWWLLQQSVRDAGSITGQVAAWQDWQARNPSHPAAIRPPQALLDLQGYRVPGIAVLLPLSGRLAGAGTAVRDGFIAAYIAEATDSTVRFYDTATKPLPQLWEQVQADGFDVVVGPLLKNNATEFAELTQFAEQPRLVLNYLDEPVALQSPFSLDTRAQRPLFELGIAIEDEADSLARYVRSHGYERVVAIHSNAQWASRALSEFKRAWPHNLTHAHFEDVKSLTEAVGRAMQVADSERRKNRLATILGEPLEFLPRARQDLDAIVAFTTNVESRALVPALKFHFGDHLPVYATSQSARRGSLDELKGFHLSEMPLFTENKPAYVGLNQGFRTQTSAFAELYALGYDAFQVAAWLPVIRVGDEKQIAGASGYLSLTGRQFRRDLNIARVDADGQLVLQD